MILLLQLPVPPAFGEAAPVAVADSREQPIVREEWTTGSLTSPQAADLSTGRRGGPSGDDTGHVGAGDAVS